MAEKRLYRSESDRMLGGVCGGFAEVYDMDPSLVRIIALLIVLGTGFGILAYLGAWLIIPTESEVRQE
jgi:phage shock protein C